MNNFLREAMKRGTKAIDWAKEKGIVEKLENILEKKLAEILANALNLVLDWVLKWTFGIEK